jgi:hypothetical protein
VTHNVEPGCIPSETFNIMGNSCGPHCKHKLGHSHLNTFRATKGEQLKVFGLLVSDRQFLILRASGKLVVRGTGPYPVYPCQGHDTKSVVVAGGVLAVAYCTQLIK